MDNFLDIIKEDINEKVSDIKDENVLKAIQILVDNLHNSIDKDVTETRDLNGYIKEWVKNMN